VGESRPVDTDDHAQVGDGEGVAAVVSEADTVGRGVGARGEANPGNVGGTVGRGRERRAPDQRGGEDGNPHEENDGNDRGRGACAPAHCAGVDSSP
jgi:hypothetical protein